MVVSNANIPSPDEYNMLGISSEMFEIGDVGYFNIYTCDYSYYDGMLEAHGMTIEGSDIGIRPLYLYFGISDGDSCYSAEKIVCKCKIIIDNE